MISSFISYDDIDKILHPNGAESSEEVYPKELAEFVHKLTRTHEIHPIRLLFNVLDEEILMEYRQKILFVVDRLFERQLRSKETNEVNILDYINYFLLF